MGFLEKLFGKKKLNYQKQYELLQSAAISGTMSKVYKAKDKQTGKLVALKILDLEKTKKFEERFIGFGKPTEGEIAMLFSDHPYIVKTLDQGLTTNNEQYIVMEYLQGTGLNNVLMLKEDLMYGARVDYIRQAAEALQAVHDGGFIHRDICPRNFIFDGDFLTMKLTDFGLSVPNRPPFTDPGNRTGTANYMAPELVRRRPTDKRLDIFSFGVTMYELCTRELPWPRGDSGLVAMSHSETPIPITDFRPQINKKLAEAIHKCIEPDVNKRLADLKQFLRMIVKVATEDEGQVTEWKSEKTDDSF